MANRSENADKNPSSSQLESDIEKLKADLKQLNQTLMGLGRETIDSAQQEGAARVEALRREADELAGRLKQRGQHQFDTLEAQVHDKPLMTLLAAFGLGMIISRIIDRR